MSFTPQHRHRFALTTVGVLATLAILLMLANRSAGGEEAREIFETHGTRVWIDLLILSAVMGSTLLPTGRRFLHRLVKAS